MTYGQMRVLLLKFRKLREDTKKDFKSEEKSSHHVVQLSLYDLPFLFFVFQILRVKWTSKHAPGKNDNGFEYLRLFGQNIKCLTPLYIYIYKHTTLWWGVSQDPYLSFRTDNERYKEGDKNQNLQSREKNTTEKEKIKA